MEMTFAWKPFSINLKRMYLNFKDNVSSFDGIVADELLFKVILLEGYSQLDIDYINNYYDNLSEEVESSILPNEMLELVKTSIANAMTFGSKIIQDFAAENVIMGITQEGMTGTVRKNMEQVILALSTGSLYDAITEAKAIPAEHKDAKYITDVRLLQFVNKIEEYLNIPLSNSL